MNPTITAARAHLATLDAKVRSRATATHLLAVIQEAERLQERWDDLQLDLHEQEIMFDSQPTKGA